MSLHKLKRPVAPFQNEALPLNHLSNRSASVLTVNKKTWPAEVILLNEALRWLCNRTPTRFFFINQEALRPAAINRAGGEGKRFDNDQRPAKRSFRTKRFGLFGLFNERSAYLRKAPGENAAAQKEMLRPRKTTTGPRPVFYFSGERFIQRSNVPERSASGLLIGKRFIFRRPKLAKRLAGGAIPLIKTGGEDIPLGSASVVFIPA